MDLFKKRPGRQTALEDLKLLELWRDYRWLEENCKVVAERFDVNPTTVRRRCKDIEGQYTKKQLVELCKKHGLIVAAVAS